MFRRLVPNPKKMRLFIVETALGTENGLSITLPSLSSAGDFSSSVQRLRKGLFCPSHFSTSSTRHSLQVWNRPTIQLFAMHKKSIHGKPIIFDKHWSEACSGACVTTRHLDFHQSSYKKICLFVHIWVIYRWTLLK